MEKQLERCTASMILILLLLFANQLFSLSASAEAEVGYAVGDSFVYSDSVRIRGYGTELAIDSKIEISVKSIDGDEITFTRIESGTVTWPRGRVGTIEHLDSHGATISIVRTSSFRVKNEIIYSNCNREYILGEGVHEVKASTMVQSGQFMNSIWGTLPQHQPLDDDGMLDIVVDPALFSQKNLEIEAKVYEVREPELVQVPAGSVSAYMLSREGERRWYDSATGLLVMKEVKSNIGSDSLLLQEVKNGSEKYQLCAAEVPEFSHYALAVAGTAFFLLTVILNRFPPLARNRSNV